MQTLLLHHSGPLGGILASDAQKEIVELRLRAGNTQFKMFPKPVVDAGFKAAQEVYAEHCDKSPEFKKVFDDMRAFQKEQILWNRYSEFTYNQYINGAKL